MAIDRGPVGARRLDGRGWLAVHQGLKTMGINLGPVGARCLALTCMVTGLRHAARVGGIGRRPGGRGHGGEPSGAQTLRRTTTGAAKGCGGRSEQLCN